MSTIRLPSRMRAGWRGTRPWRDRHGVVERLLGRLSDGHQRRNSLFDQEVEGAQAPSGLLEQSPHGPPGRRGRLGPPTPFRPRPRWSRQPRRRRPVLDQAEDHRSAVTGEALEDRVADPAGAVGDKRPLPSERAHLRWPFAQGRREVGEHLGDLGSQVVAVGPVPRVHATSVPSSGHVVGRGPGAA